MSEGQHVLAALQRGPTDMLDQWRPCPAEKSNLGTVLEEVGELQKQSPLERRQDEPKIPDPTEEKEKSKDEQNRQGPNTDVAAQNSCGNEPNKDEERSKDEQNRQGTSTEAAVQNSGGNEPNKEEEKSKDEQNRPEGPSHTQDPSKPIPHSKSEDLEAWRKDRRGNWLKPHALYMRFYRSIRSTLLAFMPFRPLGFRL